MTAFLNDCVTVIDPDKGLSFNVEYVLANSLMRKVVIINTRSLFSMREEIICIVGAEDYFKMFYGCDESVYKNIIASFKEIAGGVFHLGRRLDVPEAVICYWKNKGFQQFDPTLVSDRYGLSLL